MPEPEPQLPICVPTHPEKFKVIFTTKFFLQLVLTGLVGHSTLKKLQKHDALPLPLLSLPAQHVQFL
jgi:hypothetical protein